MNTSSVSEIASSLPATMGIVTIKEGSFLDHYIVAVMSGNKVVGLLYDELLCRIDVTHPIKPITIDNPEIFDWYLDMAMTALANQGESDDVGYRETIGPSIGHVGGLSRCEFT